MTSVAWGYTGFKKNPVVIKEKEKELSKLEEERDDLPRMRRALFFF